MNIVVNEELKAYIDPLTPEEHDALERSILAEGCRDALVLWGDVHLWMIDQHLGRRSVSDFQRGVLALRKREIVAERRARAAAAFVAGNAQAETQPEESSATATPAAASVPPPRT